MKILESKETPNYLQYTQLFTEFRALARNKSKLKQHNRDLDTIHVLCISLLFYLRVIRHLHRAINMRKAKVD